MEYLKEREFFFTKDVETKLHEAFRLITLPSVDRIELQESELIRPQQSSNTTVGFLGLPRVGKTSSINALIEHFSRFSNIQLAAIPEFTVRFPFNLLKARRRNDLLTLDDHLVQYIKLKMLIDVQNKTFESLWRYPTLGAYQYFLTLVDRGCDVMPWERAIFVEQLPDDVRNSIQDIEFEPIERQRLLKPDFLSVERVPNSNIPIIRPDLVIPSFADAIFRGLDEFRNYTAIVFLGGISLEEAMRRRREAGLPEEGLVVNPTIWPILERGYNWWYTYLIPWLIKNYDSLSIKVVDASRPMEEVIEDIYSFVFRCIWLGDQSMY